MFYYHIGTNITITGNITDEEKDPLCYPEILIEELNIQIENHKKDIELLNDQIKFQQKKIILENILKKIYIKKNLIVIYI